MPPLFLRKSAGVSRRVLTRQECVLFILSRAFQVSFGEAGEGYPVAIHAPIIRSKNHPSLNIQNRKIFVLSANNLQYASR